MILAGDGIGPEVMTEVWRVIEWMDRRRGIGFDISHGLVGGASIEAHGVPITDETMADALAADAVLLGAVGGPKWDQLPFERKPERGLLRLRKDMQLFANLRPAVVFDALGRRVNTEAGDRPRPRHHDRARANRRRLLRRAARDHDHARRRPARGQHASLHHRGDPAIARVAFDLASKRQGRVCSVEKSNVMESGVLWREEVQALHDAEFPTIELTHMYADNCAMQLVRNPSSSTSSSPTTCSATCSPTRRRC